MEASTLVGEGEFRRKMILFEYVFTIHHEQCPL
jgi:hypothetical protein